MLPFSMLPHSTLTAASESKIIFSKDFAFFLQKKKKNLNYNKVWKTMKRMLKWTFDIPRNVSMPIQVEDSFRQIEGRWNGENSIENFLTCITIVNVLLSAQFQQ